MKRPIAGAALVLALGGCSAEPPDQRPVTLPAPTSTPSSTSAAPPTSSSPATPAGPALDSQPMTAADGKNVSACRRRSCEVLVHAGSELSFATSNGPGAAVVASVGPEGIVLGVSAGISGQISSGPTAGEFASINDVKFVLAAARPGSGVLRLIRG
ncbi:hypothetical protein [Amycolatopsis sp. WGS_07]|uniref:hypothetical protein n=1 Tax=Amycolatopsis sp. WGS_07 TaxID=3076764 RepID=UPI00387314E3